ncbi:MAG TPA: dTDP-4-dehydrorhamnose reductase [Longimicrobiales bacterium]
MKIAVTGAGGMLAHDLMAAAARQGEDVIAFDHGALDVTDADAVATALGGAAPDVIAHCAAYTRVDDAEDSEESANLVNGRGTLHVARAAKACGALFIYPSTDYVFDGSSAIPYGVDVATSPLNAYGRSKLQGEHAAAAAGRFMVVRTSWLYGSHGRNFVRTMLDRGRAGAPLRVVDDQRGSPTWTVDLAAMILGLVRRDAPSGIYHATNAGDTTWYGFARSIFDVAGITADLQPVSSSEYPQRALRPAYSVLDCTRTYSVTGPARHWRDALTAALPGLS